MITPRITLWSQMCKITFQGKIPFNCNCNILIYRESTQLIQEIFIQLLLQAYKSHALGAWHTQSALISCSRAYIAWRRPHFCMAPAPSHDIRICEGVIAARLAHTTVRVQRGSGSCKKARRWAITRVAVGWDLFFWSSTNSDLQNQKLPFENLRSATSFLVSQLNSPALRNLCVVQIKRMKVW